MKQPKDIPTRNFRYNLPESKIAKYPLKERDNSRLLKFKKGEITEGHFYNIPEYLEQNTHLVFNVSKVIHARLLFKKKTGARIEIFCLEPFEPHDYEVNFSTAGSVDWKCIVGNSKKWKGEVLERIISGTGYILHATRLKKENNTEIIRFHWEPKNISFSEIINLSGDSPIPPYLNRDAEKSDSTNYQTVYARNEGSVAAPTAGLHFTDQLLKKLIENGCTVSETTLHVGAGTFTPVKEENGINHKMHIERFQISRADIENLMHHCNHITAVGTTSCRSMESLYWMGIKVIGNYKNDKIYTLGQFESYTLMSNYSREEALDAVLTYMKKKQQEIFFGSTGIMISPGYSFKMTDCLITNFHQPESTLLMLISAFTGQKWKEIYNYALGKDFRFLSYGDSSILFK